MLLLSEEPYNLQIGELIIVRVSAQNSIGWSDPSPQNSEGIQVQYSPPNAPADLLVNKDDTNQF